MGNFFKVGNTGDFKDGSKRKVSANGLEIMVVRVGDSYYAVNNRCPHMGGDLSNGTLEGTVITCPLHKSQFDVSDGRNIRWLKGSGIMSALGKTLKSPRSLRTYKIKIEGNIISVEV
jgi:3-phenylpropionate/trans-cinnamate dioxygenase ferredoxin subunit